MSGTEIFGIIAAVVLGIIIHVGISSSMPKSEHNTKS